MDTLIIGFSKSKKKFAIYSWLICWVEGTPFSHAYIRWYSNALQRDIIYQASGTMVNFCGRKVFDEHHRVVEEFQIEVSPEAKQKVVQFAIDNAGVPYGTKAALGIGLVRFMKLFGKTITNPFRDGKTTYVCSELVADILIEALGQKLDQGIDDIGPKTLYEYAKKLK